jgi:hypothetical protein
VCLQAPFIKINNPKVRNFLLSTLTQILQANQLYGKTIFLSAMKKHSTKCRVLCRKENIWVSVEKKNASGGRLQVLLLGF